MEFRAGNVSIEQNASAQQYLTQNLTNIEAGQEQVQELIESLGSSVDQYPAWHPLLTLPKEKRHSHVYGLGDLLAYKGIDHTCKFVRGFVTCPYSEQVADRLVEAVEQVDNLHAYRLDEPLYADTAYPVVVEALNISLEADGTINSRDALYWFLEKTLEDGEDARVAETWWNIRSHLLGTPHGARSSLFVNQHVGVHMRKILESMNDSGVFGPIYESSLDMLTEKKQNNISENLLRAAMKAWTGDQEQFTFPLRGESCKATIHDTWNDGYELRISVMIGDYDLHSSGFYYKKSDKLQYSAPTGKRALAEKFL